MRCSARAVVVVAFVFLGTAIAAGPAQAEVAPGNPYTWGSFGFTGAINPEGGAFLGQYVWVVDNDDGSSSLRGYEPNGGAAGYVNTVYRDPFPTTTEGRFDTISDVIFDNADNLLIVADAGRNRLLWYERTNAVVAQPVDYGTVGQMPGPVSNGATAGSGDGQFSGLDGMAISPNGTRELFVADSGNARIQVFAVTPSGLTHSRNITSGDWVSGSNEPVDVTIDEETGNAYVAMNGNTGNLIEIVPPGASAPSGGFTPDPITGIYDNVVVNNNEHVLYASNAASIDIFSLQTNARLGTYTFTEFSDPPNGVDDDGVRFVKYFDIEDSTGEIYMTRDNPINGGPDTSDDEAPPAVYNTTGWPTCTLAPPIDLAPGGSVTFTPSCTDADGAPVREFTIGAQPSLGSATASPALDSLTYDAPASGSGATSVPFHVTTMNGRSQLYHQPVNVAGPAAPPPANTPTAQKDANLSRSTGTILIKLPGSNEYVELEQDAVVPLGTIVDARDGVAFVTFARPDGSTYTGKFWAGVFQILQTGGGDPVGVVKLRDDQVGKAQAARAALAVGSAEKQIELWIAKKKKKKGKRKNQVWGDGKGKFRTDGRNGSASVRGTRWWTANYTYTSGFKVAEGTVVVRDKVKKKNVTLRKGKSYFAWNRGRG